jgi:hypothetical protein
LVRKIDVEADGSPTLRGHAFAAQDNCVTISLLVKLNNAKNAILAAKNFTTLCTALSVFSPSELSCIATIDSTLQAVTLATDFCTSLEGVYCPTVIDNIVSYLVKCNVSLTPSSGGSCPSDCDQNSFGSCQPQVNQQTLTTICSACARRAVNITKIILKLPAVNLTQVQSTFVDWGFQIWDATADAVCTPVDGTTGTLKVLCLPYLNIWGAVNDPRNWVSNNLSAICHDPPAKECFRSVVIGLLEVGKIVADRGFQFCVMMGGSAAYCTQSIVAPAAVVFGHATKALSLQCAANDRSFLR